MGGSPKDSIFSRAFYPLGCAILGVTTAVGSNVKYRRPIFAGIQRHIVFGIAGGIIGHYIEIYFENKWMKRDAIFRHYIELHPEDFKEEKRQYKEVFDAWMPIR